MLDKIENKLIDSLKNIDIITVTDLLDCMYQEVGDILTEYFARRDYFAGNINLSGINIKTLGKLKRVDGDLIVGHSTMESLGNLKVVKGNLQIFPCEIESTNRLIYCKSLYVQGNKFKTIKKLTEVREGLTLVGTGVETLNNMNLIGGSLTLIRNEELGSLGNVREIYGDFILEKCPELKSLSLLQHVGGCMDLRKASLISFGALDSLDGYVVTLKSTVNNLYESGLDIIDFKPLKNIFPHMPKAMHITVPKIDNLKDFGMIIIDDDKENLIFSI